VIVLHDPAGKFAPARYLQPHRGEAVIAGKVDEAQMKGNSRSRAATTTRTRRIRRLLCNVTVNEKTRREYRLAMIAAGHSREISGDRFTRRLFDDIKAFQRGLGDEATGATTQAQVDRLFEQAHPVIEGWGLRSLRHPEQGHAIWVPANLGLEVEPLPNGIFIRDREDRIFLPFFYTEDADHAYMASDFGYHDMDWLRK
jgi:hypothetical protein